MSRMCAVVWLLVVVICISLHPITAVVFRLGYLHEKPVWNATDLFLLIDNCLQRSTVYEEKFSILTYRQFLNAYGKTLLEVAESLPYDSTFFHISHALNNCSPMPYIPDDWDNKTSIQAVQDTEKEIYLHASLAMMPSNTMAAKNLAFDLEWSHESDPKLSVTLLQHSLQLLDDPDPGMALQSAFVSPTYLWNDDEAFFHHIGILGRIYNVLHHYPSSETADPNTLIREFQLNNQYLGVSPGIISRAYGMVMKHLFPITQVEKITLEGEPLVMSTREYESGRVAHFEIAAPSRPGQIRVGVVSEHESNSSPGICLDNLLILMSKMGHKTEMGEEEADFEFVFFARENTRTTFSAHMREISTVTRILVNNAYEMEYNRDLIAAERLDILLYIALPTEKLSLYLSYARLAPIQVGFGVGHPLTSGSMAVDYSIVSSSMYLNWDTLLRTPPDINMCLEQALVCEKEVSAAATGGEEPHPSCDAMRANGCATSVGRNDTIVTTNSEQLVVFDSLGYYLEDLLFLHDEYVDALSTAYFTPCMEMDELIKKVGLSRKLKARHVGCLDDVEAHVHGKHIRIGKSVNIYTAIQIPKKMHPSFDIVIAGIIRKDPFARIILDRRYQSFIPRLIERQQISKELVDKHIILVPRLPHYDYQQLMSLTSVFLNTFPFGAGITSSEAIALCIPLVIHSNMSSVMNLALAQTRALGEEFVEEWVVDSFEDYIDTAVRIANMDRVPAPTHVRLNPQDEKKQGRMFAYRKAICEARHKLFGDEVLHEVTHEWASFFKAII